MTIEQAYEDYKNHIQKDKELFRNDLINCLKAIGMWEVDVIRNHDGAIWQFVIRVPKTPGVDPRIEFHKYTKFRDISDNPSGNIPSKNTEAYIQDVFRVWNPKKGAKKNEFI